MKYCICFVLLLLPFSAVADCEGEKISYMTQRNLQSANNLIACLETALIRTKIQTADNDCPSIPTIPISEPKPGNPVGAEGYYAYLQYYYNITGLSPIDWMRGASAAIQGTADIALSFESTSERLCKYSVPLEKFQWRKGKFVTSGNYMNVWIVPKVYRERN